MAAFQDVLSHDVRRLAAVFHHLPILQPQAAAAVAGLAGQQIGTGLYLAAKKREHSVFFVNYHKCNLADFSGI
jgi:hypothetical protein